MRGFTLIELMIVIAIVGILAAVAIPQFNAYRAKSFNAAAEADLRNAATAQEGYFTDHEEYADSIARITGFSYGFYTSQGVWISCTRLSPTRYNMRAYHESGNKTYTLYMIGGRIRAE